MENYFDRAAAGLLSILTLFLTFCTPVQQDELVVYSGRSRSLVEDLVADFEKETGAQVNVRYGNDAELLAVLNEEGDRSSADLYWANTTGALATASDNGLLKTLPDSLLNKPDAYGSSSKEWIPVTVRFRVLAYNPNKVDTTQLPSSVMELPEMTGFEGRVGWTPTYSSFYDFLTTMRVLKGEEATRKWLLKMQQLEPRAYGSNTPMVQAIAAGEIDLALTNHYYVLRLRHGGEEGEFEEEEPYEEKLEERPDANIATYHFKPGDIGNLALVTGATELATSDNSELAQRFLSFLLSRQAQRYAAQQVHEYPVIRGVDVPGYMLEEDRAFQLSPDYDYEQLKNLKETLTMLREAGLI
ncbi:MAG: iron ABC transporter substrate-binding protein [Balneolaceae bacterium]|nr:iron ABC transporter substrate-binding protein [Balneolaceae bacterium]